MYQADPKRTSDLVTFRCQKNLAKGWNPLYKPPYE